MEGGEPGRTGEPPKLEDLPSWTIGHLVDRIGSTDAAPGGGAAGGVAIALAAACALKAIVITLVHQPDDPELAMAAERLRRIADEALEGAAGDASAFEALIAAYRLPKGAAVQADVRHASIEARAAKVAAVGARLGALAIEARGVIEGLGSEVRPNMITDVRAALALARAAEQIHAGNLGSNWDAGT